MSRVTEKLELDAVKVGLEINTSKTKIMEVQYDYDARVALGGDDIDEVSSFICNDVYVREEVRNRVAKAGVVFQKNGEA